MDASPPSRVYLELDSATICASTPADFRRLLDNIRKRAGLTSSQIAIKTTIPRSQAYNLVAATRTTLPSKPEQVRQFVEACGLSPVQVGLVMSLWEKLDQQTRVQAQRALTAAGSDADHLEQPGRNFQGGINAPGTAFGAKRRRPRNYTSGFSPHRRTYTTSDLLFLVLDNDDRTRRALRLMLPITLAVVAIVAILVVWAIMQPGRTPMIVAVLASGFALPINLLRGLRLRR